MGRLWLCLATSIALMAQNTPVDQTHASPLARVESICVDTIAGVAPLAEAVREMAFAALYSAKRFTVLERCEKAQAKLKGAILESAEYRRRSESEGIGFGAIGGAVSSGTGAIAGVGGSNGESLSSSETRRQASVSLRLMDQDGVVIWAYSQDSTGGKTKGPAADAMDRAIRQLLKEASRSAQ